MGLLAHMSTFIAKPNCQTPQSTKLDVSLALESDPKLAWKEAWIVEEYNKQHKHPTSNPGYCTRLHGSMSCKLSREPEQMNLKST